MKYLALVLVIGCNAAAPARPDAVVARDAPRAVDATRDAPPDAEPDGQLGPDLTCLGQAAPSTAPDPLAITGTVFAVDHYHLAPAAGAAVALHRRSDDSQIAQATTAADGTFAMSVASGGVAVDGYFTVSAATYLPSRIDPGAPLTGGHDALMLIANDAEVARWYAVPGATYSASSSTLVTAAVDCTYATVAGGTLAVTPAASVTYYDVAAQQWDATLTSGTNGFSLVANSPVAPTVTQHAAMAFPPHAIVAPSGTLTIAVVQPYL